MGVAKQEESPEGAWPRRRGCGLKGGVALKGGTDCNRGRGLKVGVATNGRVLEMGRGLKGGVALTGGTAYTGGYKRGVASKGAWRQAAYKVVKGGAWPHKGAWFPTVCVRPKGGVVTPRGVTTGRRGQSRSLPHPPHTSAPAPSVPRWHFRCVARHFRPQRRTSGGELHIPVLPAFRWAQPGEGRENGGPPPPPFPPSLGPAGKDAATPRSGSVPTEEKGNGSELRKGGFRGNRRKNTQ